MASFRERTERKLRIYARLKQGQGFPDAMPLSVSAANWELARRRYLGGESVRALAEEHGAKVSATFGRIDRALLAIADALEQESVPCPHCNGTGVVGPR